MNAARAIAIACALAIAAAACGSGAPSAPRIEMLVLAPASGVRPGEKVTISVEVFDEDGDLAGGQAELGLLREGAREGDVFRVALDTTGSITRANITLDITLPAGVIPGNYTISVVILDAATRRSNPLTTTFVVR